jgi:hypothetical protein
MIEPYRVVREYKDLVGALVERRHEIGMSAVSLDARAGWQEGYTSKIENWDKPYGRGIGPVSLPLWLESLGLGLIIVKLDDRKVKPTPMTTQLSLDLCGGRMNTVKLSRNKRAEYSLVALCAA